MKITIKATPHQLRKFNRFYESAIACLSCKQPIKAGDSRGIFSLNSKHSVGGATITAGAYCIPCDNAMRAALNIRKVALGVA